MENNAMDVVRQRESLLDAILPHVAFDGWSDAAFRAAAQDSGLGLALARVIAPRGALDLASDYHRRGDAMMAARIAGADLSELRFRDRVALAVRYRLENADREVVRRGSALYALPMNAGTGARLIWGTADAIWRALGDNATDINWYSKRATLAAVYSATVLYWLGDDSEGHHATWEFLDRRIADVMRFEKTKAQLGENRLVARFLAGPLKLLDRIQAPAPVPDDLPGQMKG